MYEEYNYTQEDREAAIEFSSLYSDLVNFLFLYHNGYAHIVSLLNINEVSLGDLLEHKKNYFYVNETLKNQFTGVVFSINKNICEKISCFTVDDACIDEDERMYNQIPEPVNVCQLSCKNIHNNENFDVYWDNSNQKCMYSNTAFKEFILNPRKIIELLTDADPKHHIPSLTWNGNKNTYSYNEFYCNRYRMDYNSVKDECSESIASGLLNTFIIGKELKEELIFDNIVFSVKPLVPVLKLNDKNNWYTEEDISSKLVNIGGDFAKIYLKANTNSKKRIKRSALVEEEDIKWVLNYLNENVIERIVGEYVAIKVSKLAAKKMLKKIVKSVSVVAGLEKVFVRFNYGKKYASSRVFKAALIQTIVNDLKYQALFLARGPKKLAKVSLKSLSIVLFVIGLIDIIFSVWDRHEFGHYLPPDKLNQVESLCQAHLEEHYSVPEDRKDLLEITVDDVFALVLNKLNKKQKRDLESNFLRINIMLQMHYLQSLDKNSRGEDIVRAQRTKVEKINFLKFIIKENNHVYLKNTKFPSINLLYVIFFLLILVSTMFFIY